MFYSMMPPDSNVLLKKAVSLLCSLLQSSIGGAISCLHAADKRELCSSKIACSLFLSIKDHCLLLERGKYAEYCLSVAEL